MKRVTVLATVAVLSIVGCGSGHAGDKAGGDVIVLRLGTIDVVNNNGQSYGPQAFVDQLGHVSGGRLKIELVTNYGGGSADAESTLVRSIASGELDGGWPATRAFDGAGIRGLGAVEAPMTITSYAAEKALVTGPVVGPLLSKLDGTGVLGLGLAVGPLRRPFARGAPLLGPADWDGAGFRTFNSPVQADVIRALGGRPAHLGFNWVDEVRAGALRGGEFDIAQYATNGWTTEAGNITANVVLWPKVFVLSVSRKRFDSLTDRQQRWVREAATLAVQASVEATYDETGLTDDLCAKGARFVEASPDQIRALRARTQPVLDRIASDPTSGPLLQEVLAVGTRHPKPEVPSIPAGCRHVVAEDSVGDAIPMEVSALPEGTYRAEITRSEASAAGLNNNEGHPAGTWTLIIRAGTYEIRCRPLSHPADDCGTAMSDGPLEMGDLRGSGHAIYFVPRVERLRQLTNCRLPPSDTQTGHCGRDDVYRMTWALDGRDLTFADYAGPVQNHMYLIKPWRKIT